MKKHIIWILLIFLAATGCEKFLDQAPTGEQTKEYIFQDYTRAQRYMDRLYEYLPSLWTSASPIGGYGFRESATDMAEYTANYGTANSTFNLGNWKAATTEVYAPWTNAYQEIRRCFVTLENIDSFNNEPRDENGESRKETMKGEIYFMLGFYYFDMLKRYGGVPLVEKSLSLDDDLKIPRATYEETKNFIIKYLDKAINILPDKWSSDDYGRATKIAAMALKARVLLYAASPLNNPNNDKAKWEAAARAAREAIDICEETGHHYLYTHEYQDVFMRTYPENNPEVILPALMGQGTVTFNSNIIRYGQATPGQGFQGYGSNSPTQNFVDRFEVIKFDSEGNAIGTEQFDWNNPEHVNNIYKNRDPRFYWTVIYNDQFWITRKIETWRDGSNYGKDRDPKDRLYTRTGYYLRKFWPKECMNYTQPGAATIVAFYFRYAEVLLNYAEAMNEVFGPDTDGLGKGKSITARDAVNQIRKRLVCPATEDIPNDPSKAHFRVREERLNNPDFPVLPNGMPEIPKGLSLDQMRERIINERIIELCFEGDYFFDILRWKRGPELMGGVIYGVDVVKSGSSFVYNKVKVEERFFDPSRMYLYPIDLTTVHAMGIDQNPGW